MCHILPVAVRWGSFAMSVFLQRLTLAVAIVGGALLVSGFEEAQAVMCLAGPTSLQKKA